MTTDLPSRPALRLRRPSWRDSRLVAGILLVLLSTVVGSIVVQRADDTVPMYAARVALVPGEPVTADKLDRVDVHLALTQGRYLGASSALPEGQFALRDVRAGELVPVSAIGPRGSVAVQPVTLNVDATSAASLVRGSVVDVYVNPLKPGTTQEFAGPVRALQAVSVSAEPATRGGFGSAGTETVAVSLMVPSDQVAAVIARVDDGSKITVVPVPGSPIKAAS